MRVITVYKALSHISPNSESPLKYLCSFERGNRLRKTGSWPKYYI